MKHNKENRIDLICQKMKTCKLSVSVSLFKKKNRLDFLKEYEKHNSSRFYTSGHFKCLNQN
jgi:hypothetical protein